MRMSQLSEVTGVPVPTIKYYVREGLLAPGTRSLPNQASYDESHARRLGLIRALLAQGQLSVAAARRVLDAIDSELSLPEAFEIAQHATSEQLDPASVPEGALDRLDGLLAGWRYLPENPGRIGAARILATLEEVEQRELSAFVTRYAEHALGVAEADLDEVDARPDRASKVATVVIGTVLGDALFAALRRVAQEHVTSLRYGQAEP
jgi:DNA-binding transcriptional MerR regulator